jgi:hypothetical protein
MKKILEYGFGVMSIAPQLEQYSQPIMIGISNMLPVP